MAEAIKVVDLRKFDPDKRQVCYVCRAAVAGECKIAKLEGEIYRRPTTFDASEAGVNITKIPSTCPNGYKEPEAELL